MVTRAPIFLAGGGSGFDSTWSWDDGSRTRTPRRRPDAVLREQATARDRTLLDDRAREVAAPDSPPAFLPSARPTYRKGGDWELISIHGSEAGAVRVKAQYEAVPQTGADGTVSFRTANPVEQWKLDG